MLGLDLSQSFTTLRIENFQPEMSGCDRWSVGDFWPILLKKSASISTVEKYASEIEIRVFSRRFRAQISHSNIQKRRCHRSMFGWPSRIDFFNTIGRLLTFA